MNTRILLLSAALSVVAFPALAQDGVATLRVEAGSIMTSTGGEFSTAGTGEALVDGERLMVAEGAVATVVYPSGCTRQYASPGVYVVQDTCVPAGIAAGGVDWKGAALITAGVVVGAAILDNQDDSPGPPPVVPPPVSR